MKTSPILRLTAAAAILSLSMSLISCDTPEAVVPVSTTTVTQETTPTVASGYPASVVPPTSTVTRTTRTTLIPVDD